MNLRSAIITREDVRAAFVAARKLDGADIYLEDSHAFRAHNGRNGVGFWATSANGKAASWTGYGYVIARLYNLDPAAEIGPYDDEEDFVDKVRSYQPRGGKLDFLAVLDRIDDYQEAQT